MEKFLKEEKAITLVALVITIVVLIILAGITIGALSGDNGVVKNAENSKKITDIAGEKEILDVAIVQAMGKNKAGNITEEGLREEIKEYADVEIIRKKIVATFGSGRSYEVDDDGNTKEYKKIDVETLPIMAYSKFNNSLSADEANVLSITFLNKLEPPTECYKIIDVSKNGDETVKAWLIENNENEGKYDLYIGAKDGVRVDTCGYLFWRLFGM